MRNTCAAAALTVLAITAPPSVSVGCVNRPMTVFERLLEARQLASATLVRFTEVADAANRAVMATSEDEAAKSERESEASTRAMQASAGKLRAILAGLDYATEVGLVEEFEVRFARYREVERRVLERVHATGTLAARATSLGRGQSRADALASQSRDVHSLAVSLLEKRALAAGCEETLRALQDALAKRGFTGTR